MKTTVKIVPMTSDVYQRPVNGRGILAAIFAAFAMFLALIAVVVTALGQSSSATAVAVAPPTEVTLSEFKMTPANINVEPGDVSIRITNRGNVVHDYEVVGYGKTRKLAAGESEVLQLKNVPAGHYDIRCNESGHSGSGMVGMLMVAVGASAQPASEESAPMSAEDMDRVMDEVAHAFPAATKGTGGGLMEPKLLSDGTKQFDLTASIVDWEVEPGKLVKAWTYNGVVPAPTIKVNVGDKIKMVLKNDLPESTVIHLHGVQVPNSMDGVPPYTQPPVKPGASFTYEFTAKAPAVGIYHSHHDAQIQVPNGLFGAFLIGDMPIPTQLQTAGVAKEVVMVLNDSGNIGLSLNGKSFPATKPETLKVGQSMVVHYLNEGLMAHPMHLHQPSGWIIAKDGVPLADPFPSDTVNVAPGERYSVLYTAIEPGVWAWHCHILTHAEGPTGMFGMVTALIVEA